MRPEKLADTEFEEHRLDRVDEHPDGWSLHQDRGCVLWIPKYSGIPKAGDIARFYGRGFGYAVRGVDVAGVEVYYRTRAEDEAKFRQDQAERNAKRRAEYVDAQDDLTAKINALPGAFQKRLFQFRERNPEYSWQFEAYEVECAVTAHLIAQACERRDDGSTVGDWLKKFWDSKREDQKQLVPGIPDGLSGNMFSFAVRHARFFLEQPDLIAQDHGALCALVGCDGFKACDAYLLAQPDKKQVGPA